MSWSRSPEERRWWRIAALYFAAIVVLLPAVPYAVEALRDRGLLRRTLTLLFLVLALGLVALVARSRPGPREIGVVVAAAAVYAVWISRMEILQERLHVPEYGLLAAVVREALRARSAASAGAGSGALAVGLAAVAITFAVGWLDEAIQGLLPKRYYDIRDVGFNLAAGALAVATLGARDAARAADRRRRSAA